MEERLTPTYPTLTKDFSLVLPPFIAILTLEKFVSTLVLLTTHKSEVITPIGADWCKLIDYRHAPCGCRINIIVRTHLFVTCETIKPTLVLAQLYHIELKF